MRAKASGATPYFGPKRSQKGHQERLRRLWKLALKAKDVVIRQPLEAHVVLAATDLMASFQWEGQQRYDNPSEGDRRAKDRKDVADLDPRLVVEADRCLTCAFRIRRNKRRACRANAIAFWTKEQGPDVSTCDTIPDTTFLVARARMEADALILSYRLTQNGGLLT